MSSFAKIRRFAIAACTSAMGAGPDKIHWQPIMMQMDWAVIIPNPVNLNSTVSGIYAIEIQSRKS
jgi:hypothetical protein